MIPAFRSIGRQIFEFKTSLWPNLPLRNKGFRGPVTGQGVCVCGGGFWVARVERKRVVRFWIGEVDLYWRLYNSERLTN